MPIKEREELLFQKLREKDASIVADGVICEQEFLNARYKIVYILKEVNGGKSWDLRDFVYGCAPRPSGCRLLFMRVEDHRRGIILHAGRKEFCPGKKNFRGLINNNMRCFEIKKLHLQV